MWLSALCVHIQCTLSTLCALSVCVLHECVHCWLSVLCVHWVCVRWVRSLNVCALSVCAKYTQCTQRACDWVYCVCIDRFFIRDSGRKVFKQYQAREKSQQMSVLGTTFRITTCHLNKNTDFTQSTKCIIYMSTSESIKTNYFTLQEEALCSIVCLHRCHPLLQSPITRTPSIFCPLNNAVEWRQL